MVEFKLTELDFEAVKNGYPSCYPFAMPTSRNEEGLSIFFDMLEYYYLRFRNSNNIDAWLYEIDKQLLTNSNEEFFGDNVCVFFKDEKVKLINYWDYDAGKENYCELTVLELRKLTIEWKWFVIDWEIRMIKGEIK